MLMRAGVGVRVGGRRVAVGSWRVRVGLALSEVEGAVVAGRRVAVGRRRVAVGDAAYRVGVRRCICARAVAVCVGRTVAVSVGWVVAVGVLLAATVGVGLAGWVAEAAGVGDADSSVGDAEYSVGVTGKGVGVAAVVSVARSSATAPAVGVTEGLGNASRPDWPVGVGVIVLGTIWIVAWQPESRISVRRARTMRMLRAGVA